MRAGGQSWPQQGAAHQAFVPGDHALEVNVEFFHDGPEAEPAFAWLFVLIHQFAGLVSLAMAVPFEEHGAEQRHDRHGEDVGSEHGEHYAQRERREEVLADPGERPHGQKDDGGGDGSSENGERDFGAALFRSDARGLAQLHVAEDVFQDDDAVVDEAGEGQSQAAQDHGVDRAPCPSTISRHATAESGTESMTATVARGLPRKSRIISPVSTRPMPASLTSSFSASLTKTD